MNYLAHFVLAFDDPGLLTGQFLGDVVKGKDYLQFPKAIRSGIMLHRFIDDFTDNSPATSELRALIRPQVGLHSGIAIDVFYDHILARDFERFHHLSLEDFADKCISTLESNAEVLPEKMKYVLHHMKNGKWLTGYAGQEGIRRALTGLSSRVKGGEALLRAANLLSERLPDIERTFYKHFPELIDAAMLKMNTFARDEI